MKKTETQLARMSKQQLLDYAAKELKTDMRRKLTIPELTEKILELQNELEEIEIEKQLKRDKKKTKGTKTSEVKTEELMTDSGVRAPQSPIPEESQKLIDSAEAETEVVNNDDVERCKTCGAPLTKPNQVINDDMYRPVAGGITLGEPQTKSIG